MPDVTSEPGPPPTAQGATAAPADDALAHLHKMSGTGSAFGTTDYVAINGTSIAAFVLGVFSALALLVSLFLVVPVAGLVCGFIALRQIRRSSGTQTGRGFAIAGMALSLLLGGAVLGQQVVTSLRTRADEQQCAAVAARFGDLVHAGRYDEAYQDLTTAAFRARPDVGSEKFRSGLEMLQTSPLTGATHRVASMQWNGEPMVFEEVGGEAAAVKFAYAMVLMKFEGVEEPGRQLLRFSNKDGAWKFDGWPTLFREEKPKKRRSTPGM